MIYIDLLLQFFAFIYPSLFLFNQVIYYKNSKYKLYVNKNNLIKNEYPPISIIIPTKSEKIEIIKDLIRNLEHVKWDKSKIEVIIVSDDDEDYVNSLKRNINCDLDVKILHRKKEERLGYKSGALLYGFLRSKGKYILTLDVDARILPDSLVKLHEIMLNCNCDAVTMKWVGYSEDKYSSLVKGLIISTIMGSEILYIGRYNSGLNIFPIGCGTFYKREILEEVGGWDYKLIQDDLELGARLLSNNRRICASDVPIFIEVPNNFNSFYIQQTRWALGTFETLIHRFKYILKIKNKISMIDLILYLLQYTPLAFVFLISILLLPLAFILNYDPLRSPFIIIWIIALLSYAYLFILTGKKLKMGLKEILTSLGRLSAYTVALSPFILLNIIRSFLKNKNYKVTPKGSKNKIKNKIIYIILLFGFIFLFESIIYLIKSAFFTGLWLFYYSFAYIYTSYCVLFKEL